MKITKFEKVTLIIVLTFSIAILMSFIGDSLHNFFGDYYCTITNCKYAGAFAGHEWPTYHWGWRHWLFMLCGLCIFIVQLTRVIIIIDND